MGYPISVSSKAAPKWAALPTPQEPNDNRPFFSLAAAIRSATPVHGEFIGTTIKKFVQKIGAAGSNSLLKSNGIFLNRCCWRATWVLSTCKKVYPSVGALRTTSAAIQPLPPGLLSTMTAWLIDLLIFSLTLRSKASGPLPAEKEVTILMGLSGYACAKAFIQINTLR